MYVSQLDRPWLETPFLFQGFEITDDETIAQLGEHCQIVYVDPVQSSISPSEIGRAAALTGKALTIEQGRKRLFRSLSNGKQHHYENQVSLKDEAPRAISALEEARRSFSTVLGGLSEGRIANAEQIKTAVKPMLDSIIRNQDAMAWLIYLRKRDEYVYNRAISTSVWSAIFGRYLGFDQDGLLDLAMGGMLLDIGMARMPADIRAKPEALDVRERITVESHVNCGLTIIRNIPGISTRVLDMVSHHHERSDGSGYPRRLQEAEIPVYGRIAGLIDCYDAMTTDAAYRGALSSYDAVRKLNELAGKHFQAELIEQFVQAMGMFPSGSIVEMNTGEVGIVIEQNRVRRLRPKVMLVLTADKARREQEKIIDLRELSGNTLDRDAMWIVCGHPPGAMGIDPADFYL